MRRRRPSPILGRPRRADTASRPTAPGRRGRLLVIDDEPAIVELLEYVLAEEHEVDAHTSARSALEHLPRGARYDLILCDLMMPDMTGMDFHEALRGVAPSQAGRMVFMTGGAFTPKASAFLRREGIRHLEKPFDPDRLRALVRELLA